MNREKAEEEKENQLFPNERFIDDNYYRRMGHPSHLDTNRKKLD